MLQKSLTGLSFDQEIPHESTFFKDRHGRFQESNLFPQLFELIADRCLEPDSSKASTRQIAGDDPVINGNRKGGK